MVSGPRWKLKIFLCAICRCCSNVARAARANGPSKVARTADSQANKENDSSGECATATETETETETEGVASFALTGPSSRQTMCSSLLQFAGSFRCVLTIWEFI